MHNLSTKSTSK